MAAAIHPLISAPQKPEHAHQAGGPANLQLMGNPPRLKTMTGPKQAGGPAKPFPPMPLPKPGQAGGSAAQSQQGSPAIPSKP